MEVIYRIGLSDVWKLYVIHTIKEIQLFLNCMNHIQLKKGGNSRKEDLICEWGSVNEHKRRRTWTLILGFGNQRSTFELFSLQHVR